MSHPLLFRLLAILPALALLGLAELGLRWYRQRNDPPMTASTVIHRPSDDPALIYELTPGAEIEREGVRIRINRAGFRDDAFPEAVAPDALRVVVLGDSVAWGLGVALEDAFPQRLEALLGARTAPGQPPPVVYNLSVDGYSTAQELRLLETRGLALEPDLILVSYVLNDPDVADGGLARYYERRFELVRLVRSTLRGLRPSSGEAPLPEEYHRRVHRLNEDAVRAHLARLGALGREHGVPVWLAVSPVFEFEPDAPYAWQDLHDWLESLCNANGLAFRDLRDAFGGEASSALAFDVWHPNAAGHERIARLLDREIAAAFPDRLGVAPES